MGKSFGLYRPQWKPALPDSANVFNDSPHPKQLRAKTMAIEPPPQNSKIHPVLRGGALVRLGGWAGAAILAVALLALTAQTDIGSERLQGILAMMSAQTAVAKADLPVEKTERPPEKDAEIKRLEALVLALASDRERLNARISGLERNLDDMTGSIKQQQASLAARPAAPPAAPAPPQQQVVPILAPLSMPSTIESVASWPATATPQPATSEAVPLPPVRVALAPVEESAAEAPRKPEIGIDLGGAANLDILNARWIAVKANFGPQLSGLYARAAQSSRPGASDYRLIAGPLPNNAAAAQLCARFITARITCRTVRFDGERLVQR